MLRAMKAQKSTYTFTRQQLEEHDRAVKIEYGKQLKEKVKKEAAEIDKKREADLMAKVKEVWDQRAAEFASGKAQDDVMAMLSYMMAVTAKVLIEEFGWTPVEGHRFTKRNRIVRYASAVEREFEKIATDDDLGIVEYSQEVYELYGIKFHYGEEEDGNE